MLFWHVYSRCGQSVLVHCLHDHHDQGPHIPSVCHPAHVFGHEVSNFFFASMFEL